MEHTSSVPDIIIVSIVSSFFIERGLAFIYETEFFLMRYGTDKSAKYEFAFLISLIYSFIADINIVSISYKAYYGSSIDSNPLLRFEHWIIDSSLVFFSFVLTAFILAGGCKPFIKLFRDVWGIQTNRARAVGLYASTTTNSLRERVSNAAAGSPQAQQDLYDFLDAATEINQQQRN